MRRINLMPPIPETSATKWRRRGSGSVRASLAALIVATASWHWAGGPQRELRRESAVLTARLAAMQTENSGFGNVEDRLSQARQVVTQCDDLASPLPLSGVLATMANLLPPEVVLTRLSITMPPPPAPTVDPKKAKQKAAPVERTLAPIVATLEGTAPNEVDVANCLNLLSASPMFANVKLTKARQVRDGDESRTSFQISTEVPMDRRYVPARKEATAHAS